MIHTHMNQEKIPYTSYNNYLRKKYGRKIYKISLNIGCTCPNRDGKIDTRGCIFCSAGGSGEFAASPSVSVSKQLEEGRRLVDSKLPASLLSDDVPRYIAYFQAYTNTYGPFDKLKKAFTEAVMHPLTVGISIATRPDCIDDDMLELLRKLNSIKPVSVELGLQTVHESTALYIRRGYTLDVYDDCVRRLKEAGIMVVTHLILGLPHETKSNMLESVRHVCEGGISGIKLQLLHVLKGTDLADEYEKGSFKVLSLDEYIDILCDCVRLIPPEIVIHRLTGDGDKKLLIAPLWSADKKLVLNTINKYLEPIRDT